MKDSGDVEMENNKILQRNDNEGHEAEMGRETGRRSQKRRKEK